VGVEVVNLMKTVQVDRCVMMVFVYLILGRCVEMIAVMQERLIWSVRMIAQAVVWKAAGRQVVREELRDAVRGVLLAPEPAGKSALAEVVGVGVRLASIPASVRGRLIAGLERLIAPPGLAGQRDAMRIAALVLCPEEGELRPRWEVAAGLWRRHWLRPLFLWMEARWMLIM